MIGRILKAIFRRHEKRRKKKAQKRMRRFFRRLTGTALLFGFAALGTFMAYTHRKELRTSLLDKILPNGKLKEKLVARRA